MMKEVFLCQRIYRGKQMDEIRLLKPTMEYEKDIMQFREELINANDNDSFAGCGSLRRCTTVEEWLANLAMRENVETCPEGGVTSDTYIAVRNYDNRIIGIIDLRHHINHPVLGLWGGHMGYSVRPTETILANGGVFEKEVTVDGEIIKRYWITL